MLEACVKAAVLAAVVSCGACSGLPAAKLYKPQVDASLLLPCVNPVLAPDNANDNELAGERIRIAKAFTDCRDRHQALVDRINADEVSNGRR